MNNIKEEISRIFIVELGREYVQIDENVAVYDSGIDSIEFMSLLVYLEVNFQIEIDYVKNFSMHFEEITYGDIIKAVAAELSIND